MEISRCFLITEKELFKLAEEGYVKFINVNGNYDLYYNVNGTIFKRFNDVYEEVDERLYLDKHYTEWEKYYYYN
jgi:hypothetical protein